MVGLEGPLNNVGLSGDKCGVLCGDIAVAMLSLPAFTEGNGARDRDIDDGNAVSGVIIGN